MCCKYWKYLLGSVEECVQWAGSSKAGFIANINWIILYIQYCRCGGFIQGREQDLPTELQMTEQKRVYREDESGTWPPTPLTPCLHNLAVVHCFKFPKTFCPYGVVSRFLTAIRRNISVFSSCHCTRCFHCKLVCTKIFPPFYRIISVTDVK